MNEQEIEILKKYSREIIHLRYKLKDENLGLCLGAGIRVELESEYEVARKIALIIFTEKYKEIDMNKILDYYINLQCSISS